MKSLLLLLLINLPNGEQLEIPLLTTNSIVVCDAGQRSVWDAGSEVSYVDVQGPVPLIDAACIPEASYEPL